MGDLVKKVGSVHFSRNRKQAGRGSQFGVLRELQMKKKQSGHDGEVV